MTIILGTMFVGIGLALAFYKQIHKYNYYIYLVTILVSLVFSDDSNIISLGFVPIGFFWIVMFSGVLDKGMLRKRLNSVRAEYAIIASILILPHAIGFIEFILEDIGILNAPVNALFGTISMVIMVPLFITSFQIIRKKLNYKQWKRIHQLAYLAYIAIFLHIILIQNDRMVIYIIIFAVYGLLKGYMLVSQYIIKKKKSAI